MRFNRDAIGFLKNCFGFKGYMSFRLVESSLGVDLFLYRYWMELGVSKKVTFDMKCSINPVSL
jgi:hypothetical protein